MKKIRIGNDIRIEWTLIAEGGGPYTPRPNSRIFLCAGLSRIEITEFSITANVVAFTFFGKDQREVGCYDIMIVENDGVREMVTFDEQGVFKLVYHSWQTGGEDCCDHIKTEFVTITSTVSHGNFQKLFFCETSEVPAPEEGDICMASDAAYEYMNGEWVKRGSSTGSRELTQAEYDALPDEEKLDGTVYYITDADSGSGGGSLSDDLPVVVTVGGVKAGSSYAAGTELEKIFFDMLSPTLNPTLTGPSAGLSFNVPSLAEVGTRVAAATATVSLNRGSINPQYTAAEPYRSGPASGYALKMQGADTSFDESNVTGIFSVPAFSRGTKGAVTFTATVEHGEGCQPKDSSGGDYGTPLPAGSVSTTRTVNFIFPFLYGVSNALEVSSLDGLAKDLSNKSNKTYSFDTANQYMRVAFDTSYGNLSSILDPNGFETISGWVKTIVGNYTVYTSDQRTTDTGADYTFKF